MRETYRDVFARPWKSKCEEPRSGTLGSQMALLSEGQQEGVGTDGQARGHIGYQGGAIIHAAFFIKCKWTAEVCVATKVTEMDRNNPWWILTEVPWDRNIGRSTTTHKYLLYRIVNGYSTYKVRKVKAKAHTKANNLVYRGGIITEQNSHKPDFRRL